MSNNPKLINPFNLLGINSNTTISELKKNYYNLSLLTHPDKGGDPQDFHIVHLAYNYIKPQLSAIKDTTYEKLEEEFEDFCKNQEIEKPPCFYEVYKETNDWLNEFNKKFEEGLSENGSNENITEYNNPFNSGYGEFMENSLTEEDYHEIEEEKVSNNFKGEIVKYEEPEFLPDTITYFPLNEHEIDDFSNLSSDLKCSDYKLTFSDNNKTFEELIEEMGGNKEFSDFPCENINYEEESFNF